MQEKDIKSYRRFRMQTDTFIIDNINVRLKSCCIAISDTISALILQKSPSSAFRAPSAFSIFLSVNWKGDHSTLEFRIGHIDLALVWWLIKTGNACLVRLRTPSRISCMFFRQATQYLERDSPYASVRLQAIRRPSRALINSQDGAFISTVLMSIWVMSCAPPFPFLQLRRWRISLSDVN